MKIKKYLLYFLIAIVAGAIGVSIFFAVKNNMGSTPDEETAAATVDAAAQKEAESDTVETTEAEPQVLDDHYSSSSDEFGNYTFKCPEGWEITEEGSGDTLMISDTGNTLTDNQNIMVKVIESSEIEDGTGDLADIYLDAANTGTVETIESFETDLGDGTATVDGYIYKSGLTGTESEGTEEDSYEVDMMTYITEGGHVYIIKYMGSSIDDNTAINTFSSFLGDFTIGENEEAVAQAVESGSVNILILGVDSGMGRSWGRNSARSDINMILHINLETYEATIVTVPRDLWVSIPGYSDGKINGAHAIGGPDLAVETFEQFSGLDIDNYIITDFDGFIPLIDYLGGVTVEINEDLADGFSNCYLSKGVHHLNGEQALALCRNRHRSGDGSTQGGAFAREREAAKVIKGLYEQKTTIEKILAMPAFINFLLNYTWTDMDFADIMRLLPVMGKIGDPEIELRGVPSYTATIGKASAVVHYELETEQLFEEIKNQ